MAPIPRWTKALFPSRLAAQDAANRILQYVYMFDGSDLLSGEKRVALWSDYLFTPRPSLYFSPGALELGHQLGVTFSELTELSDDELPVQRTLVIGLPEDDPRPGTN